MADIIPFPEKPEAPISVTLSGFDWFAIMLKLAGRAIGDDLRIANEAEAKMLQQLKGGK